jgi:2-polyprenyl-3-methyl-5-hydroxy-6-metoxy-1,4-benzoquinol methylase
VFHEEDGTPRLIAEGARCEVRIEFSQSRSEGACERLTRAMVDPPLYTGSDPLPYHLDAAHAFRLARCPPGTRVLEMGCGGGQNRSWMSEHGLQYVGTDISKVRVFEWLREYGG